MDESTSQYEAEYSSLRKEIENCTNLSAYLIAVLEPRISGYNWETLNSEYEEKGELRLLFFFRNYEYFFGALICYLLFVTSLLANSIQNPLFTLDIIVGLSLLVYIFLVSYRANHTNVLKESSVHIWKKISQDCNK